MLAEKTSLSAAAECALLAAEGRWNVMLVPFKSEEHVAIWLQYTKYSSVF